jgi:hypothetical protein
MVGKACRIRIDDTVFTFAHTMSMQRPSGNFHATSIGISTGRFSYPDKISTQWRFANISRANVVGETNTFGSDASSRRDYQTSGVMRNARTADWFNPEGADTSRHRVLRSRGHVLFGEVWMHSLLAATSRIIDAKSPAIARRCPRPVGSRPKGVPCEAGEALGVEPDLVERAAKVRPGSTRKRIGSRAFRRRTWTNGHRAAAESIRDANVST